MSIHTAIMEAMEKGYSWQPQLTTSTNYKHWLSQEDFRRCLTCARLHGKIWHIYEEPETKPLIHPNGRCKIVPIGAIAAGTATMHGQVGADWVMKQTGDLPDYYVSQEEAEEGGWRAGKWLSNFIPGKMMGGKRYYNSNGHLPEAAGRIWYEADINYETGKRNGYRLLYSNDGLMFVTYDHFESFLEII